ncbi:RagB/SusD family nutrient uptake outer membrane protein [Sunxiuqinia sp. sy24]|uniref:RagB/SusD family nutrient uptake outer membrane protein n=1 Tax=Sunxiuqinia sp. sy24 TaxID=3461495 RepID=UPI00404675CF
MKKIEYILALLFLFSITGCNKFLDILPDDKPVLEDAFIDAYNSEKYLFTCYSYLPPVANPLNTLGLTGGGDILYSPDDLGESMSAGQPAPMRSHFQGNIVSNPYMNFWDGSNGAPRALWDGIRHCNVFLENIPVENGGPKDLDEITRERWIAEVKALKAYFHFYLFQLYGPIPIMDEVTPISDKGDKVNVYRAPVDEVVAYIVNTLDEAIPFLPTLFELDNATEYGRITKTIAWSIKAKTLVLAASPIFNNNNYYAGITDNRGTELFPAEDSQALWENALAACDSACRHAEADGAMIFVSTDGGNNAIKGVSSANISDTTKAMISLRQAITESWNPEIIWATNENTKRIQMYSTMLSNSEWNNANGASGSELGQRHGPVLDVVERFYSANGIPIEEDQDWANNGWYLNRYQTQIATDENARYLIKEGEKSAVLHFNRSLRFYASVGFDGGIWEGREKSLDDPSYPNFQNGKGCGPKNYGGYGSFPPSGYLVKKLSHLSTTYAATRIDLIEELYSFPIIRLADLYLLLAECLNEVGGPTKTDSQGKNAYAYLDEIRARVGMEGVVESWRNYATAEYKNKPASQEGLRDIIRQERINELAFEGAYYYDVRRWLMAEDLLNRPVTGWNTNGKTKEEFYSVTVLAQPRFSMKDYLMPIKTNTLLQNPNLVQNPGW